MKAKSIKGKSTKEIQDAIDQSLSDGFKPTLALVFSSVRQDLKTVTKLLDENHITVFGITTNG